MNKILTILFVMVSITSSLQAQLPAIQFTFVPPTGSYAALTGKVTGVSPNTYGVALFLNIFGTWWTKPLYVEPVITLNADGTFSADITTGGTGSLDAYAQQVVAYVVPLSYSNTIPVLSGQSMFPQEIIDHSVTSTAANKFNTISFANYIWQLKDTGNGTWGPGQNYFTGTNVTVDGQGRLHLAISYTNGEWRCSEVTLTNSLGYGTYRLWLDNDLSNLPTNVVFGFFTYNYNTPPYYQEIDIEFSNGSVVGAPTNWQYVIQPYQVQGNRTNFFAPSSGMSNSTHTITWMPGAVYYESFTNHVADQRTFDIQSSINLRDWVVVGQTNSLANTTNTLVIPGPEARSLYYRAQMAASSGPLVPFKTATLSNGVPAAGGESLHLNLWLNQAGSPSTITTNVYEVIISKLEFIPLRSIEPQLLMGQIATNQSKVVLKYRTN